MSELQYINEDDFQAEVLESNQPVLVDFTAVWCGPCKMLEPVVVELASEWAGKVKVVKLDVDHNANIAMQYQVMGVPTLMLFKNGQISERLTGYQPLGGLAGLLLACLFLALLAITAVGLGLLTASVAKSSGAASGLAVIYIVPMMMFGALLAVFNDTTRMIAKFTPNYYVSDSLMIIFQRGIVSSPVIWQNLLTLAAISLVVVVAGFYLFKRNEFR